MDKACNHNIGELCVAKVPFFNHLEDEEMFKIAELGKHLQYQKGEVIFHDGDPLEYLYIVHKGSVKNYQLFESGKEQLLRILYPGEFMGEHALFTEKTLDSYAEAMEKTEICAIHRNDMQELMQQQPSIAVKILQQFSNRLEQTEKLVGQLSVKDVEARIAGYLLDLAEKEGTNVVQLPMSKKDLASYLGTTRETLSRRFSSFQTKGWIVQEGQRKIKILNIEALENVSEQQG